MLDLLRQFFKEEVWTAEEKAWDKWLEHIQARRNTIHAYRSRELGTFEEFYSDVRQYAEFLQDLTMRLPEPPSDWS